ncbi:hypothetical protein AAC387_Pa01g1642 [Persea americana]
MQMEVVGGTATWRGLTVKNIFSFVLVVFSVLIHVCIVGRAFRSSLMATNRGERSSDSSIGMSSNDLELLPCFDFKANEKGSSPVDCAVCLGFL